MKLRIAQWPRAAWTVGRSFGIRGAGLRFAHELRRVTGLFRVRPVHDIRGGSEGRSSAFDVDLDLLAATTDSDLAVARGLQVASGLYEAFGWEWRAFPRTAEDWHRQPLTGEIHPAAGQPWWHTKHLDPGFGDIKDLWEPSRFSWVYDLIRAYAVSRDDRFLRAFESYFVSWADANPPFLGVAWSCGQETSIRSVALRYAESTLGLLPQRSPAVWERVSRVLSASGERIADGIGYALSQGNNHGVSEAVGLVVLGERFHEIHPEADRWLWRGSHLLPRLIRQQFAVDGWYSQHSFTYQRLALDQCTVAARVLGRIGTSFDETCIARLRAAATLLANVMEPSTGTVPNHGANDSSMVHPITLASRLDFRPVVTAAATVFGGDVPDDIELDTEVLAWLGREAPSKRPAGGISVRRGASGWVAVRRGRTAVFLRAGQYRSRPGHVDVLHVDVCFSSTRAIVDPGTFRYNAPPPWRNGLIAAGVHNGPLVNRTEPGVRGPRFLWYIWPDARVVSCEQSEVAVVIVAERRGSCRRTVTISDGGVLIRDEALPGAFKGRTAVTVRWLLHPSTPLGVIRVLGDSSFHVAEEDSVYGWYSEFYGKRVASRWIEAFSDSGSIETLITDPGLDREQL